MLLGIKIPNNPSLGMEREQPNLQSATSSA
jgi:hypothetical protein